MAVIKVAVADTLIVYRQLLTTDLYMNFKNYGL